MSYIPCGPNPIMPEILLGTNEGYKFISDFVRKTNLHKIGEIFPYLGYGDVDGCLELNGSTIVNCKDKYPYFYDWVVINNKNIFRNLHNDVKVVTDNLSEELPANFVYEIPKYIVDTNSVQVWIDGCYLEKNNKWKENNTGATISNSIIFLDNIPAKSELYIKITNIIFGVYLLNTNNVIEKTEIITTPIQLFDMYTVPEYNIKENRVQVWLDGCILNETTDWDEVITYGETSSCIRFLIDVPAGSELYIRINKDNKLADFYPINYKDIPANYIYNVKNYVVNENKISINVDGCSLSKDISWKENITKDSKESDSITFIDPIEYKNESVIRVDRDIDAEKYLFNIKGDDVTLPDFSAITIGNNKCSWMIFADYADIPNKKAPVHCFSNVNRLTEGMVILWSGYKNDIPDGWLLCNGKMGTPDLRDKFILGTDKDQWNISNTNTTLYTNPNIKEEKLRSFKQHIIIGPSKVNYTITLTIPQATEMYFNNKNAYPKLYEEYGDCNVTSTAILKICGDKDGKNIITTKNIDLYTASINKDGITNYNSKYINSDLVELDNIPDSDKYYCFIDETLTIHTNDKDLTYGPIESFTDIPILINIDETSTFIQHITLKSSNDYKNISINIPQPTEVIINKSDGYARLYRKYDASSLSSSGVLKICEDSAGKNVIINKSFEPLYTGKIDKNGVNSYNSFYKDTQIYIDEIEYSHKYYCFIEETLNVFGSEVITYTPINTDIIELNIKIDETPSFIQHILLEASDKNNIINLTVPNATEILFDKKDAYSKLYKSYNSSKVKSTGILKICDDSEGKNVVLTVNLNDLYNADIDESGLNNYESTYSNTIPLNVDDIIFAGNYYCFIEENIDIPGNVEKSYGPLNTDITQIEIKVDETPSYKQHIMLKQSTDNDTLLLTVSDPTDVLINNKNVYPKLYKKYNSSNIISSGILRICSDSSGKNIIATKSIDQLYTANIDETGLIGYTTKYTNNNPIIIDNIPYSDNYYCFIEETITVNGDKTITYGPINTDISQYEIKTDETPSFTQNITISSSLDKINITPSPTNIKIKTNDAYPIYYKKYNSSDVLSTGILKIYSDAKCSDLIATVDLSTLYTATDSSSGLTNIVNNPQTINIMDTDILYTGEYYAVVEENININGDSPLLYGPLITEPTKVYIEFNETPKYIQHITLAQTATVNAVSLNIPKETEVLFSTKNAYPKLFKKYGAYKVISSGVVKVCSDPAGKNVISSKTIDQLYTANIIKNGLTNYTSVYSNSADVLFDDHINSGDYYIFLEETINITTSGDPIIYGPINTEILTVRVPAGSTTADTFKKKADSLGITVIEY